jgi:hemerythrin-like domain-containing protein
MGPDTNILTAMARDHARMEDLLQRYERGGAAARRRVYGAIRDLVTTHAFAEETVLFPCARRVLADGEGMTAAIEREHQRANELMADMEDLDPGGPAFAQRAAELFRLLRTDARQEEDVLLPAMAAATSEAHLETIGATWTAARRTAPNRPHPAIPRRPPGNVLAGVPLAVTDRLRNLARTVRRPSRRTTRGHDA